MFYGKIKNMRRYAVSFVDLSTEEICLNIVSAADWREALKTVLARFIDLEEIPKTLSQACQEVLLYNALFSIIEIPPEPKMKKATTRKIRKLRKV
jgi:hypothetical protein